MLFLKIVFSQKNLNYRIWVIVLFYIQIQFYKKTLKHPNVNIMWIVLNFYKVL